MYQAARDRTYQRGCRHQDLVSKAGKQLAEQQGRGNVHEDGGIPNPSELEPPRRPAVNNHVGAEHKLHQGLAAGKGPQGESAIHLGAKLDAKGHAGEEHKGARAGEAALDGFGEGDDGIPGSLHLDGGLADGADEGLLGALAVGDPGEHAVLVGLEGAGARVDPGGWGVGGFLIGEADEAAPWRVGSAWSRDCLERLGGNRGW